MRLTQRLAQPFLHATAPQRRRQYPRTQAAQLAVARQARVPALASPPPSAARLHFRWRRGDRGVGFVGRVRISGAEAVRRPGSTSSSSTSISATSGAGNDAETSASKSSSGASISATFGAGNDAETSASNSSSGASISAISTAKGDAAIAAATSSSRESIAPTSGPGGDRCRSTGGTMEIESGASPMTEGSVSWKSSHTEGSPSPTAVSVAAASISSNSSASAGVSLRISGAEVGASTGRNDGDAKRDRDSCAEGTASVNTGMSSSRLVRLRRISASACSRSSRAVGTDHSLTERLWARIS